MRADQDDGDGEEFSGARVRGEFWRLVGIVNVGVLAASLGVMLLAFTDRASAGIALLVLGVASLAYGYRRYRGVRARISDNR